MLVNLTPDKDVNIGFITYPAQVSALTALVSFGVSGIYLSFLLTVIGAIIARHAAGSGGPLPAWKVGLAVCIGAALTSA